MGIGKQIQLLRKQKNITQETLAAEMGVSVAAVSKWEMAIPCRTLLCCVHWQIFSGLRQMNY